jgi:hypothetical protein
MRHGLDLGVAGPEVDGYPVIRRQCLVLADDHGPLHGRYSSWRHARTLRSDAVRRAEAARAESRSAGDLDRHEVAVALDDRAVQGVGDDADAIGAVVEITHGFLGNVGPIKLSASGLPGCNSAWRTFRRGGHHHHG